jgi:ribosome biogenesis GTPase
MDLLTLGWNDRCESMFGPFRDRGWTPARVAMDGAHPVTVATASGNRAAVVAGRLDDWGEPDPPVIGDWVGIDTREDTWVIRGILPRSNVLARRRPGTAERPQALAANVHTVVIVESLDRGPNPRRIERGVALAWDCGATPVVVLTKADINEDPDAAIATAHRGAPLAEVVAVSAIDGTGIDALERSFSPGTTGVVVGPSGAGKSTLINRLVGDDLLATGGVRHGDSKGRHTTTRRQLVPLPSGACLIDSPGIRELGLWLDPRDVDRTFEEIKGYSAGCRFRDCRHENEPGCAVRKAVAAGEVDPERVAAFLKLRREAEALEQRRDIHQARIRDRRFGKMVRTVQRLKGLK